jgi:uncharacterized membrane protein HdeD (DUF308 family)
MADENTVWDKIFIGFGILTIISGVLLVFQDQAFIGIPGSIVGVWLVVSNLKKIKGKNIK